MKETYRHTSPIKCYHLIMRGVGQQIIFEDTGDGNYFLKAISENLKAGGVTLMAYCLMENHVHLLAQGDLDNIATALQRAESNYAKHFNEKYDRTGHLFQNRFLSEVIYDDAHLCNVFRYILNNPAKAGISPASKYRWSSYSQYGKAGARADTTYLAALIGSWDEYEDFIGTRNMDEYLEYDGYHHDDTWGLGVIRSLFGVKSGTELQAFDRNARDSAIRELRAQGLTVRQISRLTGISRGVVQRR